MRPNLKSHNITDLRLSLALTLSDDLISQIRQASPPDTDGDSIFADSYKVDEVGHRAWVWVTERDKDTRKSMVYLNYELGKGGRLSKTTPRIYKLLDILSSIEDAVDIDCQVNFKFDRRQKAKPIIDLPIKLLRLPDMPFDEIDAVHMVKRDGKGTKYDVLLGYLEQGRLMEFVFFHYHTRIQQTIVDEVIGEAVDISDRFILKGE